MQEFSPCLINKAAIFPVERRCMIQNLSGNIFSCLSMAARMFFQNLLSPPPSKKGHTKCKANIPYKRDVILHRDKLLFKCISYGKTAYFKWYGSISPNQQCKSSNKQKKSSPLLLSILTVQRIAFRCDPNKKQEDRGKEQLPHKDDSSSHDSPTEDSIE